jgi:hypothetical protein
MKTQSVISNYTFSFLWGFGLVVISFDLLDTIYRFIYTPLFLENVTLPDGRLMELPPLMLFVYCIMITCELIGINHLYHKRTKGAWWTSISVSSIAILSVWFFNSDPSANFIMWHVIYVGIIILITLLPVIFFRYKYT